MVHQHFMLVPSLSVAENVVLGREPSRNGLTDEQEMYEKVRTCCTENRLDVDVEAPVHALSVGVQQRVEILKALYRGADVEIPDKAGWTAFSLAAIAGHKDIVQIFIAKGVNFDARVEDGCTALHLFDLIVKRLRVDTHRGAIVSPHPYG